MKYFENVLKRIKFAFVFVQIELHCIELPKKKIIKLENYTTGNYGKYKYSLENTVRLSRVRYRKHNQMFAYTKLQ